MCNCSLCRSVVDSRVVWMSCLTKGRACIEYLAVACNMMGNRTIEEFLFKNEHIQSDLVEINQKFENSIIVYMADVRIKGKEKQFIFKMRYDTPVKKMKDEFLEKYKIDESDVQFECNGRVINMNKGTCKTQKIKSGDMILVMWNEENEN